MRKAWSNGPVANLMQGHFMALLPNLLTSLLVALESAGVTEQKVLDRRAATRRQQPPERRVPAQELVRHALCLTRQLIRLVRHCLRVNMPRKVDLPLFACRLKVYL